MASGVKEVEDLVGAIEFKNSFTDGLLSRTLHSSIPLKNKKQLSYSARGY